MSAAKVDMGDIVSQLEPVAQICGQHVNSLGEAALLSIAVSMKRIADASLGACPASLEDLAFRMGQSFELGRRNA